MPEQFQFDTRQGHIRPSWNVTRMILRKRLTDRKIAQYEREGYYSPEIKAARRELWAKRAAKRAQRDGNFIVSEGRPIFSPR